MEIIKEFVPSFFIIIIIIMMISCIYWDEKSKLYDYFLDWRIQRIICGKFNFSGTDESEIEILNIRILIFIILSITRIMIFVKIWFEILSWTIVYLLSNIIGDSTNWVAE